jgi:hypothetical protein
MRVAHWQSMEESSCVEQILRSDVRDHIIRGSSSLDYNPDTLISPAQPASLDFAESVPDGGILSRTDVKGAI